MSDEQFKGDEDKAKYIERLCKVVDSIHKKRFGFASGPCDCCCGDNPTTCWRSTGDALRWLEALADKLPERAVAVTFQETYTVNSAGDFSYEPVKFMCHRGDRS